MTVSTGLPPHYVGLKSKCAMNAAMTTKVGGAKHLSYQTRAFMYNIAIETSKKKKKHDTE